MASSAPLAVIKHEAASSQDLEDDLADPVLVECGHAFCRNCVTRYRQIFNSVYLCAQCRQIIPEPSLGTDYSESARPKQPQSPSEGPSEGHMCPEHEERLKLFCKDDEKPICVVCSVSQQHRHHSLLPRAEAAQAYKGLLQNFLHITQKKLEGLMEQECREEQKVTEMKENLRSQRKQITSVYEKLQKFFKKEKWCHLRSLEGEEKHILANIQESVTTLKAQQSSLQSEISVIESKCQLQDMELLKDVKSAFSRYKRIKVEDPQPFKMKEEVTGSKKCLPSDFQQRLDLRLKIIEFLETFCSEESCSAQTDPGSDEDCLRRKGFSKSLCLKIMSILAQLMLSGE